MNPERRRRPLVASTAGPRRHKPDYWLLILSAILLAIGLIVVYAISPALSLQSNVSQNYYFNKQLIAVLLGVVIFVVAALVPLQWWRRWQKPLIAAAVVATMIALVLPVSAAYPAHRWIRLGGFSLQSVEVIKFALLISLAAWLADAIKNGVIQNSGRVMKVLVGILVVLGLVVALLQKDLGSAGVMVAMMAAMCFVAGLPMKRIMIIGGILLVGLILVILPFSYRRERLATFLHPTSNCSSSGYQACQALIAVGSGGMIGLGLGRSVQAYGYEPEAANDSIFAIYAENFGFVGVTVLLGLFIAFFTRLKRIIERAPDDFTRLIVTGILAWFSTQTIINIGGIIGVLPLKGITLPFISYGGTSVVFIMAAVGVAFQISRYTYYGVPASDRLEGKHYDDSTYRRRLGGAYHPAPGSRPRT